MESLHPFLNPYSLSVEQIIGAVIVVCVVIPILGHVAGRMLR